MAEVILPPDEKLFEVTYWDTRAKVWKLYGHSATAEGADAMKQSILISPGMRTPQVRDLKKFPRVLPDQIKNRPSVVERWRSYDVED